MISHFLCAVLVFIFVKRYISLLGESFVSHSLLCRAKTIVEERKTVGELYTVDGKTCFDTMMKLRASLREGGCNEPQVSVGKKVSAQHRANI